MVRLDLWTPMTQVSVALVFFFLNAIFDKT